jgi:hypothetical protein
MYVLVSRRLVSCSSLVHRVQPRVRAQTRFRQRHVAAKKLQAFWRGRYAGRLMAWLRERNQAALRIIVRASARACLAPARGARAR